MKKHITKWVLKYPNITKREWEQVVRIKGVLLSRWDIPTYLRKRETNQYGN